MHDWSKPFVSGFIISCPDGRAGYNTSERCFTDSGNLAFISQLAEADTANAVIAKICVGTAADFAAVVLTGRELCRCLLLENH